jgi:hypothetical protein
VVVAALVVVIVDASLAEMSVAGCVLGRCRCWAFPSEWCASPGLPMCSTWRACRRPDECLVPDLEREEGEQSHLFTGPPLIVGLH